ncbi:MAG: aminotransferase class I/II-fold pyridoxal phosphate-dependent enzyme [Acidobacteriia bacterium]|nr:aminotransferase class I/II-fold pyridoxal phosphate-dependent enzyme [Terriglobia bacterium]
MSFSRRSFLGTLGLGATAAAAGFSGLEPIAFGEPLRASTPGGPILLNANENAYGMFPSVEKAAVEGLRLANRYPFKIYNDVVERIAAYNKVSTKQVLLGNGSTEVLAMASRAFTGPGRKLIAAIPTFESSLAYSRDRGAQVVEIPLTARYAHDLDAMLARAGSDTGLVYICNPNNPTASLTPRRDLEAFLRQLPADTYVLIDEAYHHFATDSPDYVSFIEKPVDDPRVIVARTFSKVYGMAGLRLGYSFAAEKTTKLLQSWQLEDNGNMIALHVGLAALADDIAMRAAVARNAADRKEFMRQAALRKLHIIPSYANFAMVETGRPVRQVIQHFHSDNIAVGRPFPRMENFLRVSFSKSDDMAAFWQSWDKLPALAKQ